MAKRSRRTTVPQALSHSSTLTFGVPSSEGAGYRQTRLEHILLDELQALIRDEAGDPSLEGVTLLSVHLSPDGGHARIAYAVAASLESEEERGRSSRDGLKRATGFLRSRLAEYLNVKRLPKLTFTFVGTQQEHVTTPGNAGGEPCPK